MKMLNGDILHVIVSLHLLNIILSIGTPEMKYLAVRFKVGTSFCVINKILGISPICPAISLQILGIQGAEGSHRHPFSRH